MFIALIYSHFPCSIAFYYKRAFKQIEGHEIISAGPAYGNYIPWKGGMFTPYADNPDVPLPQGSLPAGYVEASIRAKYGKFPDVLIVFNAAYRLEGKPSNCKYFIVGTDGHCVDYDADRQVADKLFNMHKFYSKPGDIIMSYAFDPEFAHPLERTKEYDCCLIGMEYEHRIRWADALRAAGVSVYMENGPCYADALELYQKARIGLNWSSLQDLNARSFEIKAMGLPCVENIVPDLYDIFKPEETFGFVDDVNDRGRVLGGAVQKVKDVLADYENAKKVAAAGLAAVQGHTYKARAEQILQFMR